MSSPEPNRRGAPIWKLAALIGGAAAIALGVLWVQERSVAPAEVTGYLSEHDEDVSEVAEDILMAIVTYTPETVEAQAETIRTRSTGQFLDDYEDLIAGGLGEVVAETSAISEGEIASGPEVGFVSAERATAVARIVQEVRTAQDATERTVFSVMQLSLVLEDGRWKADALEILSQNSL